MIILNIAAGKIKPILEDDASKQSNLLVNLDTSYYSYMDPDIIEEAISAWNHHTSKVDFEYYCKEDAFTFMERTNVVFDRICVYRFLEHVPMDRVLYFIYLLSTVLKSGEVVDIIVPNYYMLAVMLYNENVRSPDFEANNILLTTEILNEPGCPHASIWTPDRARHFMEMEGRFKVENIEPEYNFDGRDIYLRFQARRK